jgi:hypothetical protein
MAICTITVENDADFYRQFVYQTVDSLGNVLGPIDLTGNKLRMGIRQHAADIAEELLLTTENGGLTIVDAPNGKFTVRITQAQLVQLEVGQYDHSLVRIPSTTETYRIWSGTLTTSAGPSRGSNT